MGSGVTENVEFTDQYNNVDVYWTYDGIDNVGEIKHRMGYKSTTPCIVKGGAMLEKYKYDSIMSIARNNNKIPWYIMSFTDGITYLFNLNDIEPNWVEEVDKYPKTTMGDNTKVTKVVTYIPLDKATNKVQMMINHS